MIESTEDVLLVLAGTIESPRRTRGFDGRALLLRVYPILQSQITKTERMLQGMSGENVEVMNKKDTQQPDQWVWFLPFGPWIMCCSGVAR